jgi:hypothetical protein
VAWARRSVPSHPRQLNGERCGPAVLPAAGAAGAGVSCPIYGGSCCGDEGEGDNDSHGGPDYGTGVSGQVRHPGRRDYRGGDWQTGGPRASCAGHCVIASGAKRRKPDQAGGEGWLGSRRRREQQRKPLLQLSGYRCLLSYDAGTRRYMQNGCQIGCGHPAPLAELLLFALRSLMIGRGGGVI